MNIFDLISMRRTIRRFSQKPIDKNTLISIVDTGRKAPSAANKQPLEFILVDDSLLLPAVFAQTRWAAYLPKDEGRPPEGQEPTAYVVVLVNKELALERWTGHDVGAAVENMTLTALSLGIGSCWIGSLNRDALAELLRVPDNYEIDSVLALGYPDEQPVEVPFAGSVEYYKKDGVLHVPKREFKSVFHHNMF